MCKVERGKNKKLLNLLENLTYRNLKKLRISGIIYSESKRDVTLNFIKHFNGSRPTREGELL